MIQEPARRGRLVARVNPGMPPRNRVPDGQGKSELASFPVDSDAPGEGTAQARPLGGSRSLRDRSKRGRRQCLLRSRNPGAMDDLR